MTAAHPIESVLVVEFQGDVIRTLPVTFSTLKIGRAPDNDLSLQHPGVSRHHVELSAAGDGMLVTDLGSANGTYVDGVRILPFQPTRLESGRALRLGPFFLEARRSPGDPIGWTEPLAPNGHSSKRAASRALDLAEYEQALATRAAARRPMLPAPNPIAASSKYLQYLPSIFAENDFLGRYLLIFESIWEPSEQRQDHMSMYFDPATCPAGFLTWLAGWFDMAVGAHWPERRMRDLLGQAMDLYRWRGTRYGMMQMIELWTGFTPEIQESPADPFVFHVRLKVPKGAQVDARLVEDLLRAHKPAHAGFVLEIASHA
ncbi:MAG: FHA domain-containing protein [Chloroflexota bacterium]